MPIQSWEVSDAFWQRVKPLIPKPLRDPNKTYKRKPGAGRKRRRLPKSLFRNRLRFTHRHSVESST